MKLFSSFSLAFLCLLLPVLDVQAQCPVYNMRPGSSIYYCGGSGTTATVAMGGSSVGNSYQLIRNGNSAIGNVVSGTGTSTMKWTVTQPGTYTVIAYGGSCGGGTQMGGSTVITDLGPAPSLWIKSAASRKDICQGESITFTAEYGSSYTWYRNGQAISSGSTYTPATDVPGTYIIKVEGTNGCGLIQNDVVTLYVGGYPTASILAQSSTTICPGSSVVLQVQSNGNTFEWWKDGQLITGATGSTYPATQSGSYTFKARFNGSDCPTESAPVTVQFLATNPAIGGAISGGGSVPMLNNQGSLTLSGHTGNVLRWEKSEDGGTTWLDVGNGGQASYTYVDLQFNTQFRAVVQTTGCGASTAYATPSSVTMLTNLNWIHTRLFNENYTANVGVSPDGLTYYSPDPIVLPLNPTPPASIIRYVSAQSITVMPPYDLPSNIELIVIDGGGIIGESRAYADYAGKPLQSLSRNLTTGQLLASQPLYGRYGNAVGQTLVAPVGTAAFNYVPNFITGGGNAYDYLDFDNATKVTSPDPVDNATPNTLGWYYSANNTMEPYVAQTGYPYSRGESYEDGTEEAKRAAGIGDELRMGKGRESMAGTFPVVNELSHYLTVKSKFFPASVAGNTPISLQNTCLQQVGTDANGQSIVTIMDQSGHTVMSARAGALLQVNNSVTLTGNSYSLELKQSNYISRDGLITPTGYIIDCYNCPMAVQPANIVITATSAISVYDQNNLLVYSGSASGYNIAPSVYVRIVSANFFTVDYDYRRVSTPNVIFPGRRNEPAELINQATSKHSFYALGARTITASGGSYVFRNRITNATGTLTGSPNVTKGFYDIKVNNLLTMNLTYDNSYSDISYLFYDQLGRLMASLPPKGVEALINQGLNAYATASAIPFITLYEYDQRGRLTAMTEPDAGRTEYAYRNDGKIRFSQNAEQRNTAAPYPNGRYSYTEYDAFGQAVESGEYVPAAAAMNFATVRSSLLSTQPSAANPSADITLAPAGTRQDWSRTTYDAPVGNSGRTQEFVAGKVSYTENVNAKTWYSYDEQGRLAWTVQSITGLTGNKTIDYTYDFSGNVLQVAYQAGQADAFHHYYSYDVDQRLSQVQTSRDGISKALQAKYFYYTHGPLKRVELGDQLQGMDYVYTVQGWLKAINHADKSRDPGGDGITGKANVAFAPDAFGMTLEYFNGDYIRTGSNIASMATGNADYFDGQIRAQSWWTKKTPAEILAQGAQVENPTTYAYQYDAKYQLTQANWGSPNFATNVFTANASNAFQESVSSYDAHGNIIGLQRKNAAGTLTDNFSYAYTANTNRLSSVGGYGRSYTYDATGQLLSESGGAFAKHLSYNVSGLVTKVHSDVARTTAQLKVSFDYDEGGLRIKKYNATTGITTYYVRDVSGNVMAIYEGSTLKELPLYASGRIGTLFTTGSLYRYELKDHLGNVRALVNAAKLSGNVPDLVNYTDYYAFGSSLRGVEGVNYRYGYQGEFAEKDRGDETDWNSFELRMYDARIGRWLSVDPMGQYSSPYVGMGNNPVSRVDPNGGFDTKGGAWLWKLFNGGGDISYNKESGTYQVSQTSIEHFEGQELTGIKIIVGREGNKWDGYSSTITAFDRGGGADGANTGTAESNYFAVSTSLGAVVGDKGRSGSLQYTYVRNSTNGKNNALHRSSGPGTGFDIGGNVLVHFGINKVNHLSTDDFDGDTDGFAITYGVYVFGYEESGNYRGLVMGYGFAFPGLKKYNLPPLSGSASPSFATPVIPKW